MTRIRGLLKGHRVDRSSSGVVGHIVHVADADGGEPAANAFVFVEPDGSRPRARYLSFINYYDLEFLQAREPGSWEVVDPPQEFERRAQWHPFGWADAPDVRTVAWYQVEAVRR